MADLAAIVAIEGESYPDAWSEEDFRNFLDDDKSFGYIATCGNTVVGFVLYEVYRARLYVADVAVSPKARGLGVGSLLMQSVFTQARALARPRVTLDVRVENENAIRLYTKLGFRRVRIKRGYYYEDGGDALYMALDLASS